MKVAVSGKGGVGKTTLSALLAYWLSREGRAVLAVDADPDANLGSALGISPERLSEITPIAKMDRLIVERTGAQPGTMGQWFRLNPRVDDIPETFWVEAGGVKLVVMGGLDAGGQGCACPGSTLLKALLGHMMVEREETVIVDMEAGLEHLGRGTASAVDAFIVVVEPGRRSFQTAKSIRRLAQDIGVRNVFVVANKVKPGNRKAVREALEGLGLLGVMPYDARAIQADLEGKAAWEAGPELLRAAREIKDRILSRLAGGEDTNER
ncbi:MAG: carbon monoxide dehydrogenase accessory protein CooC [Bacillota bacterium]